MTASRPKSKPRRKPARSRPSRPEFDVRQFAENQIYRHIEACFSGHSLADLVGAVLRARGFHTEIAGPGPDGGVDILASKGTSIALQEPYICVQVKSSKHPETVVTLRALQGSMKNFGAQKGLLVAWGGFTKALISEARQNCFQIRLWNAETLVKEIYSSYELLPDGIKASLRLERMWVLKA